MFVRAGLVSLGLLLLSRVLGLVRESALAAAFGTSGLGDLAVLMLSLPDWLAGLLAGGTLSYVLLPHWAAQDAAQQARSLRRMGHGLLLAGVVLALAIGWQRDNLLDLLVPGLPPSLHPAGAHALVWSGWALPAALLAALWSTRLQHGRDFTGLYAASLVVNAVVVAALAMVAVGAISTSTETILGLCLLLAMLARLAWLRRRMRRLELPAPADTTPAEVPLPAFEVWLWAGLVAGLPLALPFVARSLASHQGEGALATFNYAWKLVELPLVLAIQLVATLAFPGISKALAEHGAAPGNEAASPVAAQAIRAAFALSWALACAAVAALLVAAPALAGLLFGWGRMGAPGLAQVAAWGSAGAWGLLPQALTAVALVVLAGQGRLRLPVCAYALALAGLLLAGGGAGGASLMWLLNALFGVVALVTLSALGRPALQLWLPWRSLLSSALALALVLALQTLAVSHDIAPSAPQALALACVAAIFVVAVGWFLGADLRRALRR